MAIRFLLAFLTICVAGSCSPNDAIERMADVSVRDFATRVENLVIENELEQLRDISHPELAALLTDEVMAQLQTQIPEDRTPTDRTWHQFRSEWTSTNQGKSETYYFARLISFEAGEVVFEQRLFESGNGLQLFWLRIAPLTNEVKSNMSFSFNSRSFSHYIVLFLLVFLPMFTIFTLICIWRTRKLKRPILWSIASVFGYGSLTFNWATGAFGTGLVQATENSVSFRFIDIHLFSASAIQQGFGPWIVTLAFPAGATLFWILKNAGRLATKSDERAVF